MATEREEIRYEGGRGGKFQKRPNRRSNTTPYDRPPTALRNSAGKGWLSKLVDPAQDLITSSAHRLFSTVFRKRLPPPPASLPVSPEANEMGNENQGEIEADPPETQEGPNLNSVPSIKSANSHGVADLDLEKILKEKTFTSFEIDRLTELLKSRVSDVPSGVEERKFEHVPSTPVISYGTQEVSLKFPAQDGVGSHGVPTNVVSANVLDEDAASPAEIAKAYMGSRPPKATPLSMGSYSRKFGDFASGNPSKSSTLSLVPRSPGNFDAIENGFVTPRSRGRSALYSMPRMPYSRVIKSSSTKNSVATTSAYRATESSSQSAWEQDRFLGTKQGTLKRRSSVLDDEMGSGGPMRRTRQKSTLLYPKGLSFPSGSTSIPVSAFGSGTSQHIQSTKVHPVSSSVGKALYTSGTMHNSIKMSAKSKNDMKPSSSFQRIPLRSSEMALKILEQLEKMTPPKEKSSELKMRNNSPMKLSPSMLHGPALRSLEDVQDLTSPRDEKVEESSSLKLKVPNDKSISAGDGVGSSVPTKDALPSSSQHVTSVGHSSQTKGGFQLSAHEDIVNVDEGYSNGPVTDVSFERREKVNGSLLAVSKPSDTEAITVDKPQGSGEIKPSTVSERNKVNDQGKPIVPVTAEKSPIFSFARSPESALTPEKIVSPEAPKATASVFGFGDKFSSQKESISSAPTSAFGNKVSNSTNEQNDVPVAVSVSNVSPAQQASVPTTFKFGDKAAFSIAENAATENGSKNVGSPIKLASSLVNEKEGSNVSSASAVKAESSRSSISSFEVPKESVSDKAGNKRSNSCLTVGTPEKLLLSSVVSTPTPTPTSSLFSFSSPATNSNPNNGPLVSTPSIFSSPATAFSNSFTNQNSSIKPSFTAAAITPSLSTSSPMPSFSANTISISAPAISAPSVVGFAESKAKLETTFGNVSGIPPSDTSAAKVTSAGNSLFQFGAASTTDSDKRREHSTFAPSSIPATGALAQSSPTPFGLAGNSGSSAASSPFGFSAPASPLFSSGSAFGFAFSSSSANNSVSSSAGTSSSLFNWPSSSAAPSFSTGFGSNPTGGFSFGLSSSSAASNTAPSLFGSSSTFSFTSAATPASSQPAFGNSNQGFTFGLTPPATNEQASMDEDTVQAVAPSTPTFGQQQTFTSPPPSTPTFGQQQTFTPPPSSGFAFASTAPPPLAASPFQFGGQPNVPTPQNASPFQASGSLDLHASGGGSFSLGTGGVDKSKRRFVKVKRKK